jgi:protein-S-isoprenylcysteine O-methyltransferase Ste14
MSRLKKAIIALAMPAVIAAIIFVSAGRWDLPFVWAILGILAVFAVLMAASADPGMIRERLKPGPGNRDRVTRPVGTALLFTHWILVGLDVGRFHWSSVPRDVQLVGVIGYAIAMALVFWAVYTNPFYSTAVRVQTDRGHHPVVEGPYRFVRHPGYAGTMLGVFAGGLALGSWVAMIPLLVIGVLFIRRTLLEDRMLQRELDGYAEYAQRVRYRLVVGVF